jgi:hypothetical protein
LKNNVPVNASLDFINAQKLVEVEKLSKAMIEIHAQVASQASRDRKSAFQKHDDKTHVRSPKFQIGDYVLVAEHCKSGTSKLQAQVKWECPRYVTSVESDYVFILENLFAKELKSGHSTHLRFCQDIEINVTAELAPAADNNYHQLYVLSTILGARYK